MGDFTLSLTSELEPQHLIQFSVLSKTPIFVAWGMFYTSAVGVAGIFLAPPTVWIW